MKALGSGSTLALLFLVSFAAKAQVEPMLGGDGRTSADGLKRHLYEQTSLLPDELALESFLTTMRFAGEAPPEDRELRVGQIQRRMGMQPGEARDFLQYLIRMDREYREEQDRLDARMACAPERPRKSGNEIYFLFEAMYAGRRALLAEYLAIIASDLTEERWARFHDWLEKTKLEITAWTAHHKEAYEALGGDPDEKLEAICTRLLTETSQT